MTVLNFIASGSFQGTTGDISRVSQSSAHKCIRQVMDGLFTRESDYVNFPCDNISQNELAVGFASLAGFQWVQDTIDCTHVAIQRPPPEPGVFINQKGYHSINAQLEYDHRKISADLFKTGDRLKGWFIRDEGCPLQTWLMTPVRNPTNEAQERYNQSDMTIRCVSEQVIGMLKMCFRCLDRSGGALQYSPARVSSIIMMCCVLHNIAQQRGLQVEDVERAHQASSAAGNIEEEEEDERDEE
ncbi:putative nuclease HARBI1 [Heptranchias perlo]|uniref:putative nuclease HARBI1 n=1 Tax=Heptranchias perlo TaxID=212740 RepID=UPI00355999D5